MRLTFMAGAAAVVSLAGAVVVPNSAQAQPGGVAATCTVDQNSPRELGKVVGNLEIAKIGKSPADQQKVFFEAMKELETKPERFAKNPAGYNSVLAQILMTIGKEPAFALAPTTRGAVGLVTNPTEAYDVMVELDKAMKAVVAAAPSCEAEMTNNRQNEPWLANVKASLDAMSAGKMDSAEYFAKRSMLMTSANPYAHYVLANTANAKSDKATAILHWNHVVERAGTDSNYADLKANSQFYAAMSTLEVANEKSGAEQVELARKAAAAMKAILTATPNHPDAVNLLNGQVDALTLAKDTAAIPAVYTDILAKPEAASEYMLLNAGVIASRANRSADAEKLFEATLTKNPYSRDALFNLAGRYQGTNQHAKLLEKARTLLTIEPNNQDVYMLIAYAAQETRNAVKADPKNVAKVNAEKALWLDTLKTYQSAAEKLPVKVEITGFSTAAASATLKLSLEAMQAAGGSYAVTVDFLDREGKVVTTATESSGPLKQGEKKEVSLKGEGANIVGYRYKPIK